MRSSAILRLASRTFGLSGSERSDSGADPCATDRAFMTFLRASARAFLILGTARFFASSCTLFFRRWSRSFS